VPPAETRRGATGAALLYFGRSLLLTAGGFAIAIICGLLPISLTRDLIDGDVRWWVALFCILGGIAAAIIVVGRLSLVLPAGAVGDYGVTLRRAWALTRGNSFRMFAGTVLSSGPVFLVNVVSNGLLEALSTAPASVPSLLAALTLSILLFVLAAVVQASFLSYAYKTLAAA